MHIPLRKKINPELVEDYVVTNELAHKSSMILSQRNLLKKYDKQLRNDFKDPLKEQKRVLSAMSDSNNSSDGETVRRRPATASMTRRRKAATGGSQRCILCSHFIYFIC